MTSSLIFSRSLPGGLSGEIFDGGEPFEAVKKVQSATTRCVVNLTILSPLPPPSLYSFPGSSHTDYDEIQRAAKERADIVARYDLHYLVCRLLGLGIAPGRDVVRTLFYFQSSACLGNAIFVPTNMITGRKLVSRR
ncbi:hypothetical protein RRG08_061853 [Elysia crispata]|uniref:Uncharacterized protein n=1 Tax=Elysia crispata TaxID=231223 RepID=A0AAE1AQZ7_9GAST|nr:hypothetical protein RRG08_061853 [Elysia crispata]